MLETAKKVSEKKEEKRKVAEINRNRPFAEQEQFFIEKTGNTFTYFYNKFYKKLLYYTTKLHDGDVQKAEDSTIESFMKALEVIETYDKEKGVFSTWLFTIAKNKIFQDKKNNKKIVSMDAELDPTGSTLKDYITKDEYNSAIELDLVDKKVEIIKKHISQLKEPYKSIIQMREIVTENDTNMSYQEIADLTGKPLNTIKSCIRGARIIIMKKVEKEFKILDSIY